MRKLRALIVEDNEDDAVMLLRQLTRDGYEVEFERVYEAETMETALTAREWDIVLSDYSMPRFDGLMALAILKKTGMDIPFMVISGTIGEETAVQAMLAGVDDYFVKGNLSRLVPAIERELKEAANREGRRRAEKDLEQNKLRLQIALQAAGMGVWEINVRTGAAYLSPECFQILGLKSFDGTADSFCRLIYPAGGPGQENLVESAASHHGSLNTEVEVKRPDGSTAWLAINGLLHEDPEGNPTVLTGTIQCISERKNRESSLRESEENLRAIIQASTQYVWTAKRDGANRGVFDFFAKLSGQKVDSVEGVLAVMHPEDRDIALREWKDALEHKRPFSMIIRFLTTDGDYCSLSTRSVPVFNADGTFRQWIGTCNDITKRMLAEQALVRSEFELKIVSDTVPTEIWKIDRDLNVLFLNDKAAEYYSRPKNALLGRNLVELCGADAVERAKGELERVLAGESFVVERTPISRDSSLFYRYHYVPHLSESGDVIAFFQFIVDLTEIKKNADDLSKSEKRFRSLVNATAQIVWTSDAEGTIASALTPEGEVVEPEGDLMEKWIERLHPDDKERVLDEYYHSIRTMQRFKSEYRMYSNDGTYHYFVARGTPVLENDGSVREWVGTLTDITRSKNSEEELRRSEEQLRQAQKLESVGRLAGGIAHDFNNMLTAINGYSDLTLRRLDENDPLRRNIEEIKKAGERSAALTQQLLAFSRRTILQMKILDLNQIVSDSVVMFQRLIGEDIEIVTVLNPDIPRLRADSGQPAQMILNLVVNARDAMPSGGTITIETESVNVDEALASRMHAATGTYVLLSVKDNGLGIEEEIIQQIFEPFFTTKELGKGTGLGLSTVYGIVNQLHGFIDVKSTVGVGTTFDVYLPAVVAPEKQSELLPANSEYQRGTETILLVEDEELVRNLSREVLEACGYKVIEANDGLQALELCRAKRLDIDLLLTDIVMPLMSGRELAQRIQQLFPKIRILFTSGYTEDGVVRRGIRESEMNFIQKPFTFDELSGKVRKILDLPQQGGR